MDTPTRFDRDTAVVQRAPGVYDARMDTGWWIVRGPNGGYVAAVLANAIADTVDDPSRPLKSITIHYLRPPAEGAARVDTRRVRAGRSVTNVSAELSQQGKVLALATAAHAGPREVGGFDHSVMPEVPPAADCPKRHADEAPPMHARYDQRTAVGPPHRDAPKTREARTGGWIRLAEPRPWDSALLCAVADAWIPAVFATQEMPETFVSVPTLDLTVHILAPERLAALAPEDFVFVHFETRTARGGYFEEDGEVWSPDGELLARARQVGAML